MMSSHHVDPRELVKTVVLENEEKEELQTTLKHLDRNFSVLMVAVRSSLDHKLQHQQLVLVDFIRWIEHRMKWVWQLSNIVDLNEVIKKLHPYFDFIDCELIVDMSEEFLDNEYFGEHKKSLVSELKEHIAKANTLRCSLTVKQLKNQLKSIYFPHIGDLSNIAQICITLHMHNNWNDANINALYLLIQHILPHKSNQSILKYIEIDTGSVHIKYILYETKADCLIAYAQSKLQFMRLIGIFGLTINGEPILEENENMNFTFESALLKAANIGCDEAVRFLIKLGGDLDHCNEKGSTALMLASFGGHHQVVELLLKEHANINTQNKDGRTALMLASRYGHHQVVELLLKEHANINTQKENGWTALMLASLGGHNQVVELLLKEHAHINTQSKDGCTALMLASRYGHHQVVELLFKEHANINTQKEDGCTALMLASQYGHHQVVELLLKEHANINTQKEDGWTALMLASRCGHHQVVELLLKEHANINTQEEDGWTALMLASRYGHHQVVELLLKEHANINTQKEDGWTALMLASFGGHTQAVKLLLQWGADVNILNKDNYNALMEASQYGHIEVVECLLQTQADPHILAYDGSTTFSLAAYSGNRDLVNMLLDKVQPTTDEIEKAVVLSCYGGHHTLITFLSSKLPHLTNDQRELLDSCVKRDLGTVVWKTLDSPDTPLVLGLTPLMVASSCGHVDIVDALIQAGAEVNRQESHWGFTPLFFAVRGGKSFTIVETLLERNANPNVIADKRTPLDDANYIKQESISELLTKYGGQTREKLERTKEKESI